MSRFRTHTCNELNENNIGDTVVLSGFVKTIRDLGGFVFIDLRDHYGITQLITKDSKLMNDIKDINIESTICVSGLVKKRESINKNIDTGSIEVEINTIEILSKGKNVLPFEVELSRDVKEDLRLEYRFLDLRNSSIHKKIVFRAEVLKTLRDKMNDLGFIEIQTPILTSSSPEGARDYLIPSRIHPGEFYALPQAPQQFKQLLMISGFDKYFQIAPCFRDEDPRADRSPGEFYQLDFEMSFVEQDDVLCVLEDILTYTFKKLSSFNVSNTPFIRIPYKEAIDIYGTDKPDLRIPLKLIDLTSNFKDTEFSVFKDKTIKAIKVNTENQTRKFFDGMVDFAKSELEMLGLSWIKLNNDGISGSISKYITEDILNKLDLKVGQGVFFVADSYDMCCKNAGKLRNELGKRLDIIEKDVYKFCFITDFPMYELNDEGLIDFCHNPFSMPKGGLESLENIPPLEIYASQYDAVCNGYEIASGAVRNHDIDVMIKTFAIAGYTEDDIENRFGALYKAFSFGAPPHAGAAPGVDRIVMLLAGEDNIREVIAFPKNSKARDILMQAPNTVTDKQLKDIHIHVDKE